MNRWKWPLVAVAAVLLLALLAPRIPAGGYVEPTRAALENALGRKVAISGVRFRVLPRPGFTVSDVTIGEDPAIGAEPAAYVGTMRAIPRFTALLAGRLEIASVDLEDASLNLTRVDRADAGVRWNFLALLRPQVLSAFPVVHVHGGRINFKLGDMKSIFYLIDTDADLYPPDAENDPWTLKVQGAPARTDRPARGVGEFQLRGEWRPKENAATLDLKLAKSQFGDMLDLLNGYQSGIEGTISGTAHLAGPLNHIGLSGKVTVANLHGWSQSPPGGNEWPLAMGGVLDVNGQTIDVTARLDAKTSPLELRYRMANYLKRPDWSVTATFNQFPVAPVVGIGRNLGWPLPADLRAEAMANGSLGYAKADGKPNVTGSLMLTGGTITATGAPPLHIPDFQVNASGTALQLPALTVTSENGEKASVEGTWDSVTGPEFTLASDGMAVQALSPESAIAGVPMLSQVTGGKWKGKIKYGAAGWTGALHLEDAVIPFEAFSEPLHLGAADIALDGAGIALKKLNVSTGGIEAQGEYRYDGTAPRPHLFRLTIVKADAAAIEKLLLPTLRRGNFFTYAFNFGRAPQPDWLRGMRADGVLQIGSLDIGGGTVTQTQAHILWDGTALQLADLKARYDTATFIGAGTVRLDGREPAYAAEGKVHGLLWHAGSVDADTAVESSGLGADLLRNLKAKGTFEGKSLDLAPLGRYDAVSGEFELSWDSRGPRLRVPQIKAKTKAGESTGSAEPLDNGRIQVKLSDDAAHQATGEIALVTTP